MYLVYSRLASGRGKRAGEPRPSAALVEFPNEKHNFWEIRKSCAHGLFSLPSLVLVLMLLLLLLLLASGLAAAVDAELDSPLPTRGRGGC